MIKKLVMYCLKLSIFSGVVFQKNLYRGVLQKCHGFPFAHEHITGQENGTLCWERGGDELFLFLQVTIEKNINIFDSKQQNADL